MPQMATRWSANSTNVAESLGHWLVGDLWATRPDLCGTLIDSTTDADATPLADLFPGILEPYWVQQGGAEEGFTDLLRGTARQPNYGVGTSMLCVMDPVQVGADGYHGNAVEVTSWRVSIFTLSAMWEAGDGTAARVDWPATRRELRDLGDAVTAMLGQDTAPLSVWTDGEPGTSPVGLLLLRLEQGPEVREPDGRIDWTVRAMTTRIHG